MTPADLLRAAVASAKGDCPANLSQGLQDASDALLAALTTPERAAGFFGQLAHESGGFERMEENLNYSAERLPQVWPSHFAGQPEKIARCARNPEALANEVYADRMGNGSPETGDGWRYRGRGFIQLTGRDNYQRAGAYLDIDLEAEPDLAKNPGTAFRIALWFFETKRRSGRTLLELADSHEWRAMTKAINGGTHGLDDRLARIERALAALE